MCSLLRWLLGDPESAGGDAERQAWQARVDAAQAAHHRDVEAATHWDDRVWHRGPYLGDHGRR